MRRMSRFRLCIPLVVLAAVVLGTAIVPSQASGAGKSKAGIVVEHGDGTQDVRCVKFEGKRINGYQLIRESGINFRRAKFDFGSAICWLDGEGCKTEKTSRCFECDGEPGPDPKFWGYWTQEQDTNTPTESFIGAKDRAVTKGDVDYWQYDASTFPDPQPPPAAHTFAEICNLPT